MPKILKSQQTTIAAKTTPAKVPKQHHAIAQEKRSTKGLRWKQKDEENAPTPTPSAKLILSSPTSSPDTRTFTETLLKTMHLPSAIVLVFHNNGLTISTQDSPVEL